MEFAQDVFGQRMIGALLALGVACVGIGGSAPWIGDSSAFGVIARINDSLMPVFMAAGLCAALALALLGARGSALALVAMVVLATTPVVIRHLGYAQAVDHDAKSDMRVIFFNVLGDNSENAARIADALIAAGPDIAVIAESEALATELERLKAAFPFTIGCSEGCELLILSRLPLKESRLTGLSRLPGQRFARLTVTSESGKSLTLIAAHLLKPWFDGFAEDERNILISRLARIEGPVVVTGDFNATPWSRTVTEVLSSRGLAPPRVPVGSWPARLGRFGLPIDQMLVKGGARLTRLEPFGGDLGSNHRGLLAEIALPD
ncbi:endonuclease/exonuclease/phosphatase family protein [Actibacterium sp. D379-3]